MASLACDPRHHKNAAARNGIRWSKRSHRPKPGGVASTLGKSLPSALRASQDDAHTPELFPVELRQRLVLHLTPKVVSTGCVNRLRKAPTLGLNSDLHFQIVGDCAFWFGMKNHEEGAGTHIRIGPDGNDARAGLFLILNDRVRWLGQHLREDYCASGQGIGRLNCFNFSSSSLRSRFRLRPPGP